MDKYDRLDRGHTKERHYRGAGIVVRYDVRRCIHVAECVRGLPRVFDPGARPWVDADGAPADQIADVVLRCPTGALHFERTDGGPQEPRPGRNTIRVEAGGPLYLHGDLHLRAADGEPVVDDTRLALCRCGHSANKPFCDGSHDEIGFDDPGALGQSRLGEAAEAGPALTISPRPDGPLRLRGALTLCSHDGQAVQRGGRATLCRCGHSANKPFCDGSHRRAGFEAA